MDARIHRLKFERNAIFNSSFFDQLYSFDVQYRGSIVPKNKNFGARVTTDVASRRPDTCFVFLRCNYQLKLTGFFESSYAFLTRCFFLFKFPSDIFCGFHIFLVVVVVVRNRNDHDSNSPRYYHYCGAMILFGNRSKSQQAPIELQIAHDQLSYFLILKRLNVYNKHKKKGKKKKRGTRGEYRKKETHTKQVIVNKL